MVKSAAERIASPGNAERLLDEWVDTETRLCKELHRNARLNAHNRAKSREMLKRQQKNQLSERLLVIRDRRQREEELAQASRMRSEISWKKRKEEDDQG